MTNKSLFDCICDAREGAGVQVFENTEKFAESTVRQTVSGYNRGVEQDLRISVIKRSTAFGEFDYLIAVRKDRPAARKMAREGGSPGPDIAESLEDLRDQIETLTTAFIDLAKKVGADYSDVMIEREDHIDPVPVPTDDDGITEPVFEDEASEDLPEEEIAFGSANDQNPII